MELQRKVALAQGGSGKNVKELLVYLHEEGPRRPDLFAKYGRALITEHSSVLASNEVWLWTERVLLAALDTHDTRLAEECLSRLKKKFPSSSRVRMLEARLLETQEKYEDASKIYNEILKDDPSNATAKKGKINVCKAKGDVLGAITLLSAYSRIYSGDKEVWQELAELYTSQAKYELAKFCVEELILLAPENYAHYTQYAELLFQLGGREKLELSLDYFTQSLELKPEGNLRALYGLAMVLQAQAKPSEAKLYVEVLRKVEQLYAEKQPALVDTVREALQTTLMSSGGEGEGADPVKIEGRS